MTNEKSPMYDTGNPKIDTQPVVTRFIEHQTTTLSDKSEDYAPPQSENSFENTQPVVARFIEHQTTTLSDKSENYAPPVN